MREFWLIWANFGIWATWVMMATSGHQLSDRSKKVHIGGGSGLVDVPKISWRLVKVGPMAMAMANVGHSGPDLAEILLRDLRVPQLCMLKIWWKLTENWWSYGHLEFGHTWAKRWP